MQNLALLGARAKKMRKIKNTKFKFFVQMTGNVDLPSTTFPSLSVLQALMNSEAVAYNSKQ